MRGLKSAGGWRARWARHSTLRLAHTPAPTRTRAPHTWVRCKGEGSCGGRHARGHAQASDARRQDIAWLQVQHARQVCGPHHKALGPPPAAPASQREDARTGGGRSVEQTPHTIWQIVHPPSAHLPCTTIWSLCSCSRFSAVLKALAGCSGWPCCTSAAGYMRAAAGGSGGWASGGGHTGRPLLLFAAPTDLVGLVSSTEGAGCGCWLAAGAGCKRPALCPPAREPL